MAEPVEATESSALAEGFILFAVGKLLGDGFDKLSHRLFCISVVEIVEAADAFICRWLSLSKPPNLRL